MTSYSMAGHVCTHLVLAVVGVDKVSRLVVLGHVVEHLAERYLGVAGNVHAADQPERADLLVRVQVRLVELRVAPVVAVLAGQRQQRQDLTTYMMQMVLVL